MKHRSAPKEKCPSCLCLWGSLGDTPSIRNKRFAGLCKAPKGTNTKVTSAKGHFCAYPIYARLRALGRLEGGVFGQAIDALGLSGYPPAALGCGAYYLYYLNVLEMFYYVRITQIISYYELCYTY